MANQNKKAKTVKQNLNSPWLNNALKSLGVAGTEIIKSVAPATTSTASSVSKVSRDFAKNIRSNRTNLTKGADAIKNLPLVQVGNQFFKNAISDIKSGNLYNTERDAFSGDDDLSGFQTAFDDIDSMFDDDSFDDGDSPTVIQNNVISSDDSNSATITALNKQTELQVQSSKVAVDTMVSIGSANLISMSKIGDQMLNELTSINSNLAAIVEYNNTNMTKFIEASIGYYEQNGSKQKNDTDNDYSSDRKVSSDDIFTSGGGLDLDAYIKYVQGNIKSMSDDTIAGSALKMVVDNKDMLISNPIGMLATTFGSSLIPKVLSSSIEMADKALENVIPIVLDRIGNLEDTVEANGMFASVTRTISKLFGVKTKSKQDLDLKVEKGPMPYNGVANHTIVEIIPKYLRESNSYLREIAMSITGKSDKKLKSGVQGYDWNDNKFKSIDDIKADIYNSIFDATTSTFKRSDGGKRLMQYGNMVGDESVSDEWDEVLNHVFANMEAHKGEIDFSNSEDIASILDGIKMSAKTRKAYEMAFADMQNNHTDAIASLKRTKLLATNARNKQMRYIEDNAFENGLAQIEATDGSYDDYRASRAATINSSEPTGSETAAMETSGYVKSIYDLLSRGIYVKTVKRFKGGPVESHGSTSSRSATVNADTTSSSEVDEFANEFAENLNNDNSSEYTDTHADVNNATGFKKITAIFANQIRAFGGVLNGIAAGNLDQAWDGFMAGLVNAFKRTGTVVKEKVLKPLSKNVFGEKNETTGYRDGGIFGEVVNAGTETFLKIRRDVTGEGYTDRTGAKIEPLEPSDTVFGKVKNTFKFITDSVKVKLFGEETEDENLSEEEKKKGVLGKAKSGIMKAVDSVKEGFTNWKLAFLGKDGEELTDDDKREILKEYNDKIHKAVPNAVIGAAAGVGVNAALGSSLLGGLVTGPVGALAGATIGIASQSEGFQNWLFGKKSETDPNKRYGGVISQSTQEFFKDHKNFLTGSAVVGAVTGGGIVGHLTGGALGALVGGPVAGALLGLGTGIVVKSKMFQNFLYGDAERGMPGLVTHVKKIVSSITSKRDSDIPQFSKMTGMTVIGTATGGLLGSLIAGPAGPVGAILGLGASILAQKDNFHDWLFGTVDEETGTKREGVLGQFKNMLKANVLGPLKNSFLNIKDDISTWLQYDVFDKIVLTVAPLTDMISNTFTHIKDTVGGAAASVGSYIKENFLSNVIGHLSNIFAPVTDAFTTVAEGAAHLGMKLMSAPIEILYHLTNPIFGAVGKAVQTTASIAFGAVNKMLIKPIENFVLKPVTKLVGGAIKLAFKPFEFAGNMLASAAHKLDSVITRIPIFLHNVKDGLVGWFKDTKFFKGLVDFKNDIKDVFTPIKENITNSINEVKEEAKAAVKGTLQKFLGAINPLNWIKKLRERSADNRHGDTTVGDLRSLYDRFIAKREQGDDTGEPAAVGSWRWFKGMWDNSISPDRSDQVEVDENGHVVGMKSNRSTQRKNSKVDRATKKLNDREARLFRKNQNKDVRTIAKLTNNQYSIDSPEARAMAELMSGHKINWANKEATVVDEIAKAQLDEQKDANTTLRDIANFLMHGKKTKLKDSASDTDDSSNDDGDSDESSGGGWFSRLLGLGRRKNNNEDESTEDLPHYAKGTKNAKKGAAVVGEDGPEMVVMKGGEEVVPNKTFTEAPKTIIKILSDIKSIVKDNFDKIKTGSSPAASMIGIVNGEFDSSINTTDPKEHKLDLQNKAAQDEVDNLTGEYMREKNDAEKEKEKKEREEESRDATITGSLTDMNKRGARQEKDWGGFLGKASLFVTAGLALFPLIKHFISKLPGVIAGAIDGLKSFVTSGVDDLIHDFFFRNEENTAEDGNTLPERVSEIGNDLVTGNFAWDEDGSANNRTDSALNFIGRHALNIKNSAHIGPMASTTTRIEKGVVNVIKGAGNIVKSTVDNVASKSNSKLFTKVVDALKTFFNAVKTKLGGAKVAQTITKIQASTIGALKNKWDDIAVKIAKKIGLKGGSKAGAAIVTAGASEVIFATIGAINGLTGTAKLFNVNKDKVDGTMKLISSAFGLFAGTTVGSIIDIALTILGEVTNMDYLNTAAVAIYGALKHDDDEAIEALKINQDEFMNQYVDERKGTLLEQYETQKKAGIISSDVKEEEFIEGVKNGTYKATYQSFDDWNAEKNSSLGDKIGSGIGHVWNGVKNVGGAVVNFFTGKDKTSYYDEANGTEYKKNKDGTYQVYQNGKSIGSIHADALPSNLTDTSSHSKGLLDFLAPQTYAAKNKSAAMKKAIETGSDAEITMINDTIDGVVDTADSIKEKGYENTDGGKIYNASGYVYYSINNGIYYKKEGSGYSSYNLMGDKIATGISSTKVNYMRAHGFLYEGKELPKSQKQRTIENANKNLRNAILRGNTSYSYAMRGILAPSYPSFYGGYGIPVMDQHPVGGGRGDEPSTLNGSTYFSQNDSRWADSKFVRSDGVDDGSTMGNTGCGPTAMSMVLSDMQGKSVSPIELAQYAQYTGSRDETGTNWNFIDQASTAYGVDSVMTQNPSASFIEASLRSGQPMILSGVNSGHGDSPYTKAGHYVVAVGKTGDDIIINDPRGSAYSGKKNIASVLADTDAAWAFSNSGIKPGGRGSRKIPYIRNLKRGGRGKTGITPEDIIAIAQNEVGYKEKASDKNLNDKEANAGSGNFTKYGVEMNKAGTGHPKAAEWCATFVCWLFYKAANDNWEVATKALYGANTAGCKQNVAAFKKANRFITHNPNPGDVIFFAKDHKNASHTGIFVGTTPEGRYKTIEGNATNQVKALEYNPSDKTILGFGVPDYDDVSRFLGVSNMLGSLGSKLGDMASGALGFLGRVGTGLAAVGGALFNKFLTGEDINWDDVVNKAIGISDDDEFGDIQYDEEYGNEDYAEVNYGNQHDEIWKHLRNKGYSEIGASGVMGAWQAESGNKANRLEGDYIKGFPTPYQAMKSSSSLNSYAERLFNVYDRDGVGYNRSGYRASDGNYYPGIGLAQWTGPRGKTLKDYSKSIGHDWGLLNTQLRFFDSEADNRGLMNSINATQSPAEASDYMLDHFEMSPGFSAKRPDLAKTRRAFANSIYEKYHNKEIEKETLNISEEDQEILDWFYSNSSYANWTTEEKLKHLHANPDIRERYRSKVSTSKAAQSKKRTFHSGKFGEGHGGHGEEATVSSKKYFTQPIEYDTGTTSDDYSIRTKHITKMIENPVYKDNIVSKMDTSRLEFMMSEVVKLLTGISVNSDNLSILKDIREKAGHSQIINVVHGDVKPSPSTTKPGPSRNPTDFSNVNTITPAERRARKIAFGV